MIRYTLFFTILLSACAPRPQQGEAFSEAQAIQTEALRIGEEVQKKLQELDQQRISIEVQGRALMPKELQFIADVNNLAARFEEWQKNKIQIPAKPKGSATTLLNKQKDYLDTIQAIKAKADGLTKR